MDRWLYVVLLEKTKSYNKVTKAVIERHVANIKHLDDNGYLDLCGVFKGYKGVAGMYILKTASYEEAEELCREEPLVAEGFVTYTLKALQVADRENNYLLN